MHGKRHGDPLRDVVITRHDYYSAYLDRIAQEEADGIFRCPGCNEPRSNRKLCRSCARAEAAAENLKHGTRSTSPR